MVQRAEPRDSDIGVGEARIRPDIALDWAYRFEPSARDAIEHVLGRLRIGPGRTLLDLGCGGGTGVARAERLGATTAGLDPSPELIDIARRRAPTSELVSGPLHHLPWPDDSFDAITSFDRMQTGWEPVLAEAVRVLRPGGSVAATFWSPTEEGGLRDYLHRAGSVVPGLAPELQARTSVAAPGVAEAMLAGVGVEVVERSTTSAVMECCTVEELWAGLRSLGVRLPSLLAADQVELRGRAIQAVAPFRSADGSFRLTTSIVAVIGRLR